MIPKRNSNNNKMAEIIKIIVKSSEEREMDTTEIEYSIYYSCL